MKWSAHSTTPKAPAMPAANIDAASHSGGQPRGGFGRVNLAPVRIARTFSALVPLFQ
jgi:hypothetical protein